MELNWFCSALVLGLDVHSIPLSLSLVSIHDYKIREQTQSYL